MKRNAILYNYLLIFIVAIIIVEMFVVLSTKRQYGVAPEPPLGTRAGEVFQMLGNAELIHVSFQTAAEAAMCEQLQDIGAILQEHLKTAEQLNTANVFSDWQTSVSNKLDEILRGHPQYPGGISSTTNLDNNAPFFLYLGVTDARVLSTVPWIISENGIDIAVRPSAIIPWTVPLNTTVAQVNQYLHWDRTIQNDRGCTTKSNETKKCIMQQYDKITKSIPSPTFTTTILFQVPNSPGVFVPEAAIRYAEVDPVVYKILFNALEQKNCPKAKPWTLEIVGRVQPIKTIDSTTITSTTTNTQANPTL